MVGDEVGEEELPAEGEVFEVFTEGGGVEEEAEVDDPDGEDEDGEGGSLDEHLDGGKLGCAGVDDGGHADAFELGEPGIDGEDADDHGKGDNAEQNGGDGFDAGPHAFFDVSLQGEVSSRSLAKGIWKRRNCFLGELE